MRHSWKFSLQAPTDQTKEHLWNVNEKIRLIVNTCRIVAPLRGVKNLSLALQQKKCKYSVWYLKQLTLAILSLKQLTTTILNLKQLCLPVTHRPAAATQKHVGSHLFNSQNFLTISLLGTRRWKIFFYFWQFICLEKKRNQTDLKIKINKYVFLQISVLGSLP